MQGYKAAQHPVPEDPPGLGGAGGIRSTARDMLKYLEANLHPEKLNGTLPSAIEMAHRPRAEGLQGTVIALAWWYTPSDRVWSHGGAMRGFTSNAYFHPQGDDAAVVLFNHGPEITSLADLLTEHIKQRLAGEPAVSLDAVLVPASTGFGGLLRWYGAYWFTMLASGMFTYCLILGIQGLAAQLPRRLFLRLSAFLQMFSFCLVVLGFFLQPAFGGLADLTGSEIWRLVLWLPSYWFLGLFQQLSGSMHPILVPLAQRAWVGLGMVVSVTTAAYALSYMRTLRRIVEEPDIVPGARGRRLPLPRFGNNLQTAIGRFAIRTLVRSKQHRLILAFYLGIGFAFTAFLVKAPVMKTQVPGTAGTWHKADVPLLAASIVMMVLAVVGTRVVFALPLDLRANWIFRLTGMPSGSEVLVASRRSLLLLGAAPVWFLAAVLCLSLWPWRQAVSHLLLLALLATLLAELSLLGFRKIPFACSYLPGKTPVHMVILSSVSLMYLAIVSARCERDALMESRSIWTMLVLFAVVALGARLLGRLTRSDEDEISFEETVPPTIMELGLHRDGVMPVGTPGQAH
jgi:hypothetical protein